MKQVSFALVSQLKTNWLEFLDSNPTGSEHPPAALVVFALVSSIKQPIDRVKLSPQHGPSNHLRIWAEEVLIHLAPMFGAAACNRLQDFEVPNPIFQTGICNLEPCISHLPEVFARRILEASQPTKAQLQNLVDTCQSLANQACKLIVLESLEQVKDIFDKLQVVQLQMIDDASTHRHFVRKRQRPEFRFTPYSEGNQP